MNETVKCEHKDECIDYPFKCKTCRHNKGKKSHYAPNYPFMSSGPHPAFFLPPSKLKYVPKWVATT